MNTVLDIGRLSRTEKLRAMEELWDDLSRSQDEYPSADWHGEVLRAREEALKGRRGQTSCPARLLNARQERAVRAGVR